MPIMMDMELENIVANTVYIKAREGMLTLNYPHLVFIVIILLRITDVKSVILKSAPKPYSITVVFSRNLTYKLL